jgi:hypothetical protein
MSYMSRFIAALVGVLAMTILASRQLFMFAVEREPSVLGAAGGRSHFWLAVAAGITACVAGGLMFYFFRRHETNKWSRVEMTPTGPPLNVLGGLQSINLAAQIAFDPIRWALANRWLSEGQADDRLPIDGSVRSSGDTPPGQRSFARRTHQLMFKKWSQERHD